MEIVNSTPSRATIPQIVEIIEILYVEEKPLPRHLQ